MLNLSLFFKLGKRDWKDLSAGATTNLKRKKESLLKQKPSVLGFINYWVKVITQGDMQLKKNGRKRFYKTKTSKLYIIKARLTEGGDASYKSCKWVKVQVIYNYVCSYFIFPVYFYFSIEEITYHIGNKEKAKTKWNKKFDCFIYMYTT